MNKKILVIFLLVLIICTTIFIFVRKNKNSIEIPKSIPQDYYEKIVDSNNFFYAYEEINNDPNKFSNKKYYFIETSIDNDTNSEKIIRKQYISYPQDIWREVNKESYVIINVNNWLNNHNKGDIISLNEFIGIISID